jgi:hypothetical protein
MAFAFNPLTGKFDFFKTLTDLGGVSTARTISTTAPLTGGGDLSANRTLAIAKATTLVDGYLAAADFTTFNNKEGAITAGTTAQYWRGDKTWQTLNQASVAGLTTASTPTFAGVTLAGNLTLNNNAGNSYELRANNGITTDKIYFRSYGGFGGWVFTLAGGTNAMYFNQDGTIQSSGGFYTSLGTVSAPNIILDGTVTGNAQFVMEKGYTGGVARTIYKDNGTTDWYVGTNGSPDFYFISATAGTVVLYLDKEDERVGVLTTSPTAKLDVNSDIIRLRTAKTPASASATGNQGDICWDSSYIYVCTATNTWKRAALTTW